MSFLVGVDLGGTKIAAVCTTVDGKVLSSVKIPTLAAEGKEAVIERIILSIKEVISEANVTDILGIGIGAPGPVDTEKGLIIAPPNLPGWDEVGLRDIIKEYFGVNTYFDNDANVAAIGERWFGAGRGYNDFVYITVSTGIGAGIYLGGKLHRGHTDSAGEIGHMILDIDGPVCNCGNRGCFEALASGTALAKRAYEAVQEGKQTSLSKLQEISAADVFSAANKGDILARQLIERETTYVGLGIANIITMYNPERVILGGGVSQAGEVFFEPVKEVVKKTVFASRARNTEIVAAELGSNAGALGAAALVLEERMDRIG